ncbi:MAG TPA: hypothetical protein VK615_14390 [Candidatus Binatia bacterium]|nr:hypothetical protein [Candidatus Binatia bacterium]
MKREAGKSHPREHSYFKGQPGDLFISKLAAMVVDISELDAKGNLPLTEAASRLKNALDVERVTKRFFREFDEQRIAFVEHIQGIDDKHDQRWYEQLHARLSASSARYGERELLLRLPASRPASHFTGLGVFAHCAAGGAVDLHHAGV